MSDKVTTVMGWFPRTGRAPPQGSLLLLRTLGAGLGRLRLVNRRTWPARLELQSAVFEYIAAFYNRQRRHSTLNMLSPVAFEQLQLQPLDGVEAQ